MATAPQFVPLFPGSTVYAIDGTAGVPGWVGFVYTAGGMPPSSIGIPDSFTDGHYLFAATAPQLADLAAAQAFAGAIQTWLNTNFGGFAGVFIGFACIWMPAPNAPNFGIADPNQKTIAMTQGQGVATTNNFNNAIGQLTLSVPAQVVVTVNERGLRLGTSGTGQVQFNTVVQNYQPQIANGANLPFVGNFGGTLTMAGSMTRSGPPDTISYFENGFHYRHGALSGDDPRQVYPLLVSASGQSDLVYAGAVDPLDPINSVAPLSAPASGRYRTQLALAGNPPLASWYRDDLGKSVALIPQGGLDANGEPLPYTGALVFQYSRATGVSPVRVYMTFAGDFALAGTGAPPPRDQQGPELQLLPGIFGSERFSLAGYAASKSYDRLRFQPGQPANAPVFPFPQANLNAPQAGAPKARLDDKYLTSWAALLNGPNGKSTYLAQPQGSPLYSPSTGAAADAISVLPPLETPSKMPQTPPLLLPFVPYAGITSDKSFPAGEIGEYESQILSSERKRLLSLVTQPRLAAIKQARRRMLATQGLAATGGKQATTPQGLYAEVTIPDPDSNTTESTYDAVVLARSIAKKPAVGTVDFGFTDLDAKLQDLFQTNQLMSVIVNPTHLGTIAGVPRFNRDVVIADWRMTAAVGESLNATAYNNILILKYCDGSLLERVKNPNKWVGVESFSLTDSAGDPAVALTGLSQYLQDYLANAIDLADGGNTFYQNFARIVRDPNWNGFLVLRAKVDPSGFPDQIKGLVAGIDFSRFEAHHFGVTASRVTVSGSTVTMEVPSSLFGLIDYQLPAYQQNVAAGGNADMPIALPTTGDFGFTVLQLQALFENAALVDFRSRVQLTINQLFASPVDKAYGEIGTLPASAVVLLGSYQRQGDTAVYVFEQNTTTVFTLQSNVLLAVPLVRVVFNTLSNGDDGTVRSRFLMWGVFEFVQLEVQLPPDQGGGTRPADLLSFGLPPDSALSAPPQGLRFSGLDVSMNSPTTSPNAVTFTFETGRLALDAGASKARAHSLYPDLALEVDGFIAGTEDKRPIDFGFLPVSVEPKVKTISGPWFAIVYKVTLGGPGGLAGQAGFTSRLMTAWAPTSLPKDPTSSVFVGLQLPGAAPGAKLFSIQGVLKLTIDSLILRREQVTGGDMSFVLRLNDIGLTFLGIAKLPSGSSINFFLFGDPNGSGSLGWYAAYVKKDPQPIAAEPRPALPPPNEQASAGPPP